MPEQPQNSMQEVRAEIRRLIGKLQFAKIERWDQLEELLVETLQKAEQLKHPPQMIKVYQAQPIAKDMTRNHSLYQRMFRYVRFYFTMIWMAVIDIIVHPRRPSYLLADTKTGIISIWSL